MKTYQSLNAIRFFAAFCVVLHHAWNLEFGKPYGNSLSIILGSLWFGGSAVVVFFVISGFCIHRPNIHIHHLKYSEYVARRGIRLLVPLGAVVLLALQFNVNYSPIAGWVTWSLVCELIYYLVYPFVRKNASNELMIFVFFTAGLVAQIFLVDFDNILNLVRQVIVYFPAWLLGCYLAEKSISDNFGCSNKDFDKVLWRLIVVAASFLIGFLHYTNLTNMSWGLMIFPFLVYFWLKAEIKNDANILYFAKLGCWSYSLYLVHPIVLIGLMKYFNYSRYMPGHLGQSLYPIFIALIFSYGFYWVVEYPSHRLAKQAGNILRK